ncbi:MAG: hypothetical protein U0441_33180 [Polyangiaceae bacterium]
MISSNLAAPDRGWIVPFGRAPDYTPPMPQKPADRAKEKRRLTKRLAAWRAKQAAAAPKEAPKTESKS